jgi:aminoglycoside 6'-N-acetyltransferase
VYERSRASTPPATGRDATPTASENELVLTLRKLQAADLALVAGWLTDPEVAAWYLTGSTIESEIADLQRCAAGADPTEALVVLDSGRPIGWCQWYRCDDYPEHAEGTGASRGDIGIDYAIGEGGSRGRGIGTELITILVAHIRRLHPRAGIVADPEASNLASRTVLEKNGFELVSERPVTSEPTDAKMAIYRLPAELTS